MIALYHTIVNLSIGKLTSFNGVLNKENPVNDDRVYLPSVTFDYQL